MSKYINITRVKADDMICGRVNIPCGTEFQTDENGLLYFIKDGEKKYLCKATSERGFQWFAYDEDGNGRKRSDLIKECRNIMAAMPDKNEKFEAFFSDFTAMKYKKFPEDMREWSWNREKVHTAPLSDLEHIRSMLIEMSSKTKEATV
jgi:hypothetical protein